MNNEKQIKTESTQSSRLQTLSLYDDEELIAKIDEECVKPENVANSAKLNELSAKRDVYETELESCMEEWESLSVELEG